LKTGAIPPVFPIFAPRLCHTRTLKKKNYELTDHLGNVRSVITDMKLVSGSAFQSDAATRTYYYPFGMERPGMSATEGGEYRFGYNGKEKMDD
jgi:hypothetical protein